MICLCAPLEAKEKNSLNGSPSLIAFSWKKRSIVKGLYLLLKTKRKNEKKVTTKLILLKQGS